MRQRAAGENRRERSPHQRVVVADASGPPRQMHTQLQRGQDAAAADRNSGARRRRTIAFARTLERDGFGVGDQPVAVHRDRIRLAQQPQAPGVWRAGRHLREPDRFKHALYERQQIGMRPGQMVDAAREHLFAAAAGRNEAHAHFDEPHVGLS